MKCWHRFAYFFVAIAAALSLLLCPSAASQDPKTAQPTSELQAIKPPEHPITEEQLRTFLKVTHFLSVNSQLIYEKLEVQRKQMPEWYPESVWNEISDAIENIDMASLSLPVYQKYVSEDDARFFIRFMATPRGQKLSQSLLTKDANAQHAGAAPEKAYEQAIAELARNEGAEVERILSGMSPAELREIESQSGHWQEMQPAMRQMRGEVTQVVIAKQTGIARSIAMKHQSELAEAKRSYDASHSPSTSPQTPR
jgi:hypothetical protein